MRFTAPGFWGALNSAPKSPWRFSGAGSATIQNGKLLLNGRKRVMPFVRVRRQYEIMLDRIRNVSQTGGLVSFDLAGDHAGARRHQLWALDDAQARELVAALPSTTTPDYERRSAEARQFEGSMHSLGARSIVTPVLVGLNVLAFIATAVGGGGILEPDGVAMLRFGTNYGPLTAGGEWWRLATATFLHFGIVHLLLNMWALLSLGTLTERLYGSARFAALYLFAGLCGSLASYYWHPNVNSAGASGAIFGVIGALLAFMLNPSTRIPPTVAAAQRNSALVFIAYNLFNGFAHRGIDNAAHIGGLIGGAAIGWLLARPLSSEARVNTGYRFAMVGGAALALLVAISWPIVHPSSERLADTSFRQHLDRYADIEDRAVQGANALAAQLTTHKITDKEWAQHTASEVLPLWIEARTTIRSAPLPSTSRYAAVRTALLEYLDLHIRSVTATARYLQGDPTDEDKTIAALKGERDKAFERVTALMKTVD